MKKRKLFILILFLSLFFEVPLYGPLYSPHSPFHSLFQTSLWAGPLSEAWSLVRQVNDVFVWKLKGRGDVMGTFRSSQRAEDLEWGKIKSSKFFEKLKNKKKEMLSFVGISDWKSTSHSWKKKKDHYELNMEGNYLNGQRQRVSFREYHFFFKKRTYQILLTFPSNRKLSDRVIEEFRKDVSQMVGH